MSVIPALARRTARLAQKYGPGFLVYAMVMDALVDWLLPPVLAASGHPLLGTIAFLGDWDWLTYPLYFAGLWLWKKARANGKPYCGARVRLS